MKRRLILVAVGALVLAACGSSKGSSTRPTTPALASPPTAADTTAPATSPTPASPVEGYWLSSVLTPDDARAAVPKKYWGTFVGGWKTFQYGLKIEDSYWTEFDIRDGGTPIPSDYGGTYTISGNKITRFRGPPGGQPEDAFEWQVEGDQLVLTLLLDTDGPSYGVPDHVYMHLIYESHPFTRQG